MKASTSPCRIVLLLALVSITGLVACVEATPPIRQAGNENLRLAFSEPSRPGETLFLAGSTPGELEPDLAATVEQVLDDPSILQQLQTEPRFLDQIEILFLEIGRSFELADAYLLLVESQGDPSPFRPRLALIYQRLGQYDLAERVARESVHFRPADPLAHYVLAMTLFAQRDVLPANTQEALESYRRLLELDPEYVSPDGMTSGAIRERITSLEESLGEAPDAP